MRLLLIGDHHLKSDAIEKILSRNGYDLKRISPENLETLFRKNGNPGASYPLSIVDLSSIKRPELQYKVKQIKQWKVARKVLAIHDEHFEEQFQTVAKIGADRYISLQASSEDLIKTVRKMSRQAR